MAFSPRTIRIIGASVLSVVLIFGAYAFTGGVPFLTNRFANAQSTDQLLKEYAAKDSDNDGLPDWQEALYGTDPQNPHSVSATLTDGEALAKGLLTPHTSAVIPGATTASTTKVTSADIPGPDPAPGSLTDQFGQEFLQDYMQASNGQQLSADQQQALVDQLMASYSQKAGNILLSPYTSISEHISPTASVSDYTHSVEAIILTHDVPADSSQPLPLMQAYIQNNDSSALKKLGILGASYAGITQDLLQVPVPPALATQHLALIRSFDTLSRATKAVLSYNQDPLSVMGSLTVYPAASQGVLDAMSSIAQVILTTGGEPVAGAPGYMIVNFARANQQSS